MPLLIKEDQVAQLLPMSRAIELVDEALQALATGQAENRPRQRVRGGAGVLHVMPASWPPRYLGFKAYTTFRGGACFFFHLFDAHNGNYLAIIEADRLGQIRTGAASGVATRLLARADARTAGILGTGWQAESQLEAICAVRQFDVVRAYSRDLERRKRFAEKMSQKLSVRVEPADEGRAAVSDCDVVVTATTSAAPVLEGAWLKPGAHVNAVGSNWANRREVDDETIRKSGVILVDSLEQAKIEAGDLIAAVDSGVLNWNRVAELGTALAGGNPARTSPDEITLFKSIGIALEDVAVGGWVYEQARAQGIGQNIEL